MEDSRITAEFKAEFEPGLNKRGAPPMEHFQELLEIVMKHDLMYELTEVHTKYFLVHLSNRGGLLLSPKNSHKNGADIKRGGADLELLNNSYCFELSASGPRREAHLKANKALVDRSEGLVAEVTGIERFVTAGCGHTTQFVKTTDANGITCEESLMRNDGSGRIDKQALCTNRVFEKMVNKGWKWRCFFACLDEAYPRFAQIAQEALNIRNHVSSIVGELEVCISHKTTLSDPGFQNLDNWRELAIAHIHSLCAPSKAYADVLLDFVLQFGGSDAEVITFIDSVAKQFQANVQLSEDYWTAVCNDEFTAKTSLFPLVRAALLLANLTTDKVEDGIARCVGKEQVKFVATAKKQFDASLTEDLLGDAFELCKTLGGVSLFLKPLGQMFVRLGLKLTSTEKKGREQKCYSCTQIKKMFLEFVSKMMKTSVTFAKWDKKHEFQDERPDDAIEQKGSASGKPSHAHAAPCIASLTDHNDPKYICSRAGFDIGSHVVEKRVNSSPDRVYVIFSIEDKVVLRQLCSFTGDEAKISISMQELITNWSVSKADPIVVMSRAPTELPSSFESTLKKNHAFKLLHELYQKHCEKHEFTYYRRPDHIRTQKLIKAGSLTLVPMAPCSNIFLGKKTGCYKVGECYVVAPNKPALQADPSEWDDDSIVAPFWVEKITDKGAGNVEVSTVTVAGIDMQVLQNNRDIDRFSKLALYVAPKPVVVKPLSNAKVEDGIESRAAPARKRATTSKQSARSKAVKK